MNHFHTFKSAGLLAIGRASLASVFIGVAAVGCGGGGGGAPIPEAVVSKVDDARVLEGNASGGTVDLVFNVTLDKPVVNRLEISFSTVSLIKSGYTSTPSAAKGGSSCSASEVDYIEKLNQSIVLSKGETSRQIVVQVCQDMVFEPNENLELKLQASSGPELIARGTIVNDDPGGLNSTGVTSGLLAGQRAFGRDTDSLTNNNSDGALGFSFDVASQPSLVVDKVTGLTWQSVWVNNAQYSDVQNLLLLANNGSQRYVDWRLPSVIELLSLLDFKVARGSVMNADASLGAPSMSGQFWTREQVGASASATNAWMVAVDEGGLVSFKPKTQALSVRLVRGEGLYSSCEAGRDSYRFDVLEVLNGTVYDRKTGLTWMRCAEGYAGGSCTKDTSPDAFDPNKTSDVYLNTWLQSVNGNPASKGLGFNDWRIPTVKELASLVDRCVNAPAISKDFFPGTSPSSFISSTRNANDAASFWYVDFNDGTVATGVPGGKSLRLVRGGQ